MKAPSYLIALFFSFFQFQNTVLAQWTTDVTNGEVQMTDSSHNVLIGTLSNNNSTSDDDAKLLVKSDNVLLRSIIRAEADYDVPTAEEVLRLVMPATSHNNSQFIDAKRGTHTVFQVKNDGFLIIDPEIIMTSGQNILELEMTGASDANANYINLVQGAQSVFNVRRDGDVSIAGSLELAGELTAASDKRLKKNINGIEDALNLVLQLQPVSYQFRTSEFPDLHLSVGDRFGFIAQDVENHLPQLVASGRQVTKDDGEIIDMKSVNYLEIIPLLTRAIQEQQKQITALQNELRQVNAHSE